MSAQIRSFPTQADEALRQVRPAATTAVPAGQVHASVTEAFIRLVTLLDRPATGPARFDVMVRDRVTGREHALPVTENMAVALIDASCATVSEVRPVAEHSRAADTASAAAASARRLSVVPGGATL
jgi:hypothetical protein